MLSLLLAAVAVPPTPAASIRFSTGESVTVAGPKNTAGNADYPWRLTQLLFPPRKTAAAVRFCYEYPGGTFCEVHLARPGTPVMTLKNSNVTDLLWTADGRYLIGAGDNTVRLWNLSGGVRAAVPRPLMITPGITQSSSYITRLWLDRGDLCVAAQDQLFGAQGQAKGRSVTTTRYALPTLKGLTMTNYPAGTKRQEADCMLVRRFD